MDDGGDAARTNGDGDHDPEPTDVEDLLDDLDDIGTEASADVRDELRETRTLLEAAGARGLIASGVRRLTARDVGEALVGSIVFASPLLVEDGVFEIADYLFGFTVAGVPVFLVANTAFVVLMTYALVEWTGRDRTEERRFLGVLPARVLMILVVSFAVTALLMTTWGRVGDWQPPAEALARINVLWTVGSLGAALGDVLATDHPADAPHHPAADAVTDAEPPVSDGALLDELTDQFEDLAAAIADEDVRREVDRVRDRAHGAAADRGFGDRIRKYTSRDIAEAFVGSVFFAIPLLVEDGVNDVADYFLAFRVGQFPVFFLVNAAFVLLMVVALVYWAGPQDVQMSRPIFGVIPRRMVGISVVSFLTAAMLMTMWGRVDNWQQPTVAVARVSAVWTVASFGAALGDILPGESSGDDINDELSDLGEQVVDAAEDWIEGTE